MEMKKAYTNCQNTLCVTNNLRNLNYEGVSGKISYNGDQIVERETTLFKYENDQWKRVEN